MSKPTFRSAGFRVVEKAGQTGSKASTVEVIDRAAHERFLTALSQRYGMYRYEHGRLHPKSGEGSSRKK